MDTKLDLDLHSLTDSQIHYRPGPSARCRDARPDAAYAAAFLSERLSADDAIGFALLYPTFSSLRLMRRLILNDLFVREAKRQRGCARGLLDHCAAFARGGFGAISLETAVDNIAAQEAYARSGYRRVTEFCAYVLDLADNAAPNEGGRLL